MNFFRKNKNYLNKEVKENIEVFYIMAAKKATKKKVVKKAAKKTTKKAAKKATKKRK